MNKKKLIAAVICLVLVITAALPGTLAVSADAASSDGTISVATPETAQTPADSVVTDDAAPQSETEPEAETKTCTCDPAPADGEAHKEGCPLYAAPEKPAVPSHIDTCSDDCTDADCKCPCHLFDKIMACATQEALEDLIAETPEEYFGLLSDEQIQKVEAHIKSLETVPLPAVTIENDVAEETVPSEIVRPTVNYTYVAPFGDPVTGGDN